MSRQICGKTSLSSFFLIKYERLVSVIMFSFCINALSIHLVMKSSSPFGTAFKLPLTSGTCTWGNIGLPKELNCLVNLLTSFDEIFMICWTLTFEETVREDDRIDLMVNLQIGMLWWRMLEMSQWARNFLMKVRWCDRRQGNIKSIISICICVYSPNLHSCNSSVGRA